MAEGCHLWNWRSLPSAEDKENTKGNKVRKNPERQVSYKNQKYPDATFTQARTTTPSKKVTNPWSMCLGTVRNFMMRLGGCRNLVLVDGQELS